jgi:hypothetical protein
MIATGCRASTGFHEGTRIRSLKCCAAMMVRSLGLEWVNGGHEMDALGPSLTRPLYLRELTDLMQRGSVSG